MPTPCSTYGCPDARIDPGYFCLPCQRHHEMIERNAVFEPAKIMYGDLIVRHRYAARDGNASLRERIFAAITLFEELYPVETAAWTAMYSPQPANSQPSNG